MYISRLMDCKSGFILIIYFEEVSSGKKDDTIKISNVHVNDSSIFNHRSESNNGNWLFKNNVDYLIFDFVGMK